MEKPSVVSSIREASPSNLSLPQLARFFREFPENTPEGVPLEGLLSQAAEQAAKLMNACACTVRPVEGGYLSVGAAWGYQVAERRNHPIRIDGRLAGIVHGREKLVIPDLQAAEDLPVSYRERTRQEGFRAFLGVPMVASKNVEGVFSLYYSSPVAFTDEQIDGANLLAEALAIGIQRSRSREKPTGPEPGPEKAECGAGVVLVVDDQPGIRCLYLDALTLEGYPSVVSLDSEEALEYLESHPVQLVITDLRMPHVSGWEIAQAAKKYSPRARVMLITGSYSELKSEMLREYQIDEAVPKPCPMAKFLPLVARLFAEGGEPGE